MSLLEEPKVRTLQSLCRDLPSGSRILEIGFGRGQVLEQLLAADFKVVGTEISPKLVVEVHTRLQGKGDYALAQTSDPRDIVDLWPGAIDCTLCFEVLEHLKDPSNLLQKLPKGLTYFSTPNAKRWWPSLTGRYELWDFPPNHLQRFTEYSLKELLEENSYTSVTVLTLPVRYKELLQPLYTWLAFKLGLQVNSSNYDDVRNGVSILSTAVEVIRRASWPITSPIAWGLTKRGYAGTSLLAKGIKE